MNESGMAPAVALLFADADLGAHLREALSNLGARIVHEGPAAEIREDTLAASGADVVVVNLEPVEEAYLDRVYEVLADGQYQVIFNDAEASRDLSGWDKARWARHLAAKLLGSGDVDPPRPVDARAVEALVADVVTDSAIAEPAVEAASAPVEARIAAPAVDVEERQTVAAPAPVTDWELVDVSTESETAAPTQDARQFGIDKMNAADYLKPEGADQDSPLEPGLHLELVSLEESVAPTMSDEPVSEMMLDESTTGIRRVVAVGAGADGTSEVGAFLAGLPAALPALVLLVQHQRDQSAEQLSEALGTTTRLPVAVAHHDSQVHQGQVWLVPAGQRCRLDRDGRVTLETADPALGDPSIDQNLAGLAETFGADVTAVVLAGPGHDALAGVQEIHDRGGQIWVQEPAVCGDDAMASAIHAEGLAALAGTPAELAQRLCEACA